MRVSRHPIRSLFRLALPAALAALCGAAATAAETLAGPVPAEVLRVTDGDTLEMRARIWLGQDIAIRVRLAGIDAPERRSRCAAERALARDAEEALAKLVRDGAPLSLVDIRYGKYAGRVLARVLDASGADIGAALVAAGPARAYDGRTRAPWCPARAAAR